MELAVCIVWCSLGWLNSRAKETMKGLLCLLIVKGGSMKEPEWLEGQQFGVLVKNMLEFCPYGLQRKTNRMTKHDQLDL